MLLLTHLGEQLPVCAFCCPSAQAQWVWDPSDSGPQAIRCAFTMLIDGCQLPSDEPLIVFAHLCVPCASSVMRPPFPARELVPDCLGNKTRVGSWQHCSQSHRGVSSADEGAPWA